ncbi:putative glycolipid-binding domain-containing protein [Nocardiopsis sediminis]|uniref:Glycolipid-binding domain-containing protein n=1 Tax=Nocardiopsis sediminis TaxID=1778267 RepID=A0ABV8FRU1_9ACTN
MSAYRKQPAAWTRIDVAEGLGLGALIAETDGYRLEASETVADPRERYACRFTVRTDLAWTTRCTRVESVSERGVHTLELASAGGKWTMDGKRLHDLDGCVDVDVAATPLTNTLPIRRLGLRPGEFRDIAVAWIDVPSLRVNRVVQRYTRLSSAEGRERYEYRDPTYGAFELTVDREGVVVDYEGLARRLR